MWSRDAQRPHIGNSRLGTWGRFSRSSSINSISGQIWSYLIWINMILLYPDKSDLTWVLGLLVPELGSKTASLPSPWLGGGFQMCSKRHLPRGCVVCRLKMRTTTEQKTIQCLSMSNTTTTTTSTKQIKCNHNKWNNNNNNDQQQ